MSDKALYSKKHYMAGTHDELVNIIRLLKEGLEEISSDDSSECEDVSDLALETLQLMEDTCKSSEIEDIKILPKLLNT